MESPDTVQITFVEHDGTARRVEARVGESVMRAAVRHMAPGILGECGGAMACGTCQGYIAPGWAPNLNAISRQEEDLLAECIGRRPESRLTCQITVAPALDGLVVTIPERQT
jgi:ferredoxin, 2Fe-2S